MSSESRKHAHRNYLSINIFSRPDDDIAPSATATDRDRYFKLTSTICGPPARLGGRALRAGRPSRVVVHRRLSSGASVRNSARSCRGGPTGP
jgi:hypothetical protein